MASNNAILNNTEIRKVMLIGLGGAGQMILMNVKRFLIDTYNIVPPCIRFLSMDTDGRQTKLASKTGDKIPTFEESGEFLHLVVENPMTTLKEMKEIKEGKEKNYARDWFVGEGSAASLINGTGAIRQNGRLALFANVNEFTKRIRQIIDDLDDQRLNRRMSRLIEEKSNTNFVLSDNPIEVCVCGSIAGGTGSGTFLDTGFFLRHLLPRSIIQGYFLLHWPYRNKPFAPRTPGNVYAALTELDYFQSIRPQDAAERKDLGADAINYGGEQAKIEYPPFSIVNLVDGRNEVGQNVSSLDMLCEIIAQAVVLSAGPIGAGLRSVTDNLATLIGAPDFNIWDGKNACYSSLGVSSIYYPAPELQRAVASTNALALSQQALAEATEEFSKEKVKLLEQQIHTDVVTSIKNLETYLGVKQRISPSAIDISFRLQRFQTKDVELLTQAQKAEEEIVADQLKADFQTHGTALIQTQQNDLQKKLDALSADPKIGILHKSMWLKEAIEILEKQKQEASKVLADATNKLNDLRTSASDYLQQISQHRYIPIPYFGRDRTDLVEQWRSTVEESLQKLADQVALKSTIDIYTEILALLLRNRPGFVPQAGDITNALADTVRALRRNMEADFAAIDYLLAQTNLIVVGDGKVVIVPGSEDESRRDRKTRESIKLEYSDFKAENAIQKSQDYFNVYQEKPELLVVLFYQWCMKKLAYLADETVDSAVETLVNRGYESPGYLRDRLDDLLRLSSPLWRYDSGYLNEERRRRYDRVVNIGVCEAEQGRRKYDGIVTDLRARYHLTSDHSFSSTGDPYRIWLVSFAAPLTAYCLRSMQEAKPRYEAAISITSHIDKRWESGLPDLSPEDNQRSTTLRALGMAIVTGIDVIHDLYLRPQGGRGHKFTWDADEFKAINQGDPRVWHLFRDMYEEFCEDPQWVKILIGLLKAKVASLKTETLKECISAHIDKLTFKLGSRDITKLYSARLTYREIKALKQFLSVRGYNLNIDRYIAGT
ncbi:MAG: hypothetical protein JXA73_07280 [Acidobacteria bacterium]|nr:hypothetical protein [Acidobacteriota bacterium]